MVKPTPTDRIAGKPDHAKNYPCEKCGAPPGQWCVSKSGLFQPDAKRQHKARRVLWGQAMRRVREQANQRAV